MPTRLPFYLFFIGFLLLHCCQAANAQNTTPEIYCWLLNTNGTTGFNNLPANVQQVQYSNNYVYVSCTDIPAYGIGPWPLTPMVPDAQNFTFKIPRHPQVQSGTKTPTPLAHIGIWVNGVSIFNPRDASSYNNMNIWWQNAVAVEAASFDDCNGHPTQDLEYHHHQNPHCMYTPDAGKHSPILGFAFDGFPVYGPYAWANTDGTGSIKHIQSSYRLRNISTRTTLPNGTPLLTLQYGPPVNAQYPLGYFIEDYEYIAGLGDLDEYNGRFAVTPDYPNGTYAYYVTTDSTGVSAFPYVLGPAYYGVLEPGNTGSGSGHVSISEPVTTYNCLSGLPLSGEMVICNNTMSNYTVPCLIGTYYNWNVSSGTITNGQGSNAIGVNWNGTSGTVQVEVQQYGQPSVGLFFNTPQSLDGYTLFAPTGTTETYLIDNCGKLVHNWQSTYRPGLAAYLLPDGNLIRAGSVPSPNFNVGGKGGILQKIDWNSAVVWSYQIANTNEWLHHDFKALPNGNIIAIVWERKTLAQATAAGRNPAYVGTAIWSEKIVELQPTGTNTANIVWEWHAWDHLVQDFDNTKANFGVVADHPELINANYNTSTATDWLHFNAIDYNPVLDQIVVSSRLFSEVWVIDHSTTTAQAAQHSGGNAGKGGDLLYRWGNPQAYNRGTPADQKLFGQHDVQWIPDGMTMGGKLMVFNNGQGRPEGNYSTVEIFAPPILPDGTYSIGAGVAYGPQNNDWQYPAAADYTFYSPNVSGVQPLQNGNYLICEGASGVFFEINPMHQKVWKYVNPSTNSGIYAQGEIPDNNGVFKIKRYTSDYPGLAGQVLTPGSPIEQNPYPNTCTNNP